MKPISIAALCTSAALAGGAVAATLPAHRLRDHPARTTSAASVDPSRFTHPVDNPYYPLRPGLVTRLRGSDGAAALPRARAGHASDEDDPGREGARRARHAASARRQRGREDPRLVRRRQRRQRLVLRRGHRDLRPAGSREEPRGQLAGRGRWRHRGPDHARRSAPDRCVPPGVQARLGRGPGLDRAEDRGRHHAVPALPGRRARLRVVAPRVRTWCRRSSTARAWASSARRMSPAGTSRSSSCRSAAPERAPERAPGTVRLLSLPAPPVERPGPDTRVMGAGIDSRRTNAHTPTSHGTRRRRRRRAADDLGLWIERQQLVELVEPHRVVRAPRRAPSLWEAPRRGRSSSTRAG